MKSFKLMILILLMTFSYKGLKSQGYLSTDGNKILDSDGNPFILRGVGLGGWMLQEGYMLRTSGAQHVIEGRIEDLIGKDRTEEFYNAWLNNHVRKIDIDSMAAWGYNSVRLPMHYKLFTPPIEEEPVEGEITWIDKGFEITDRLLEWCKENNIYLILDLHAAPGGQGKNADINDYDPSKPSLWESEANQGKTVALWEKLAERYANEPMIGGYDIINEPNWGFQNIQSDPNGCAESDNGPLWRLTERIVNAIRKVDKNHIIIIEGNCWGNNYAGLPSQLWDDNIVISFHKYWNPNTQNAIQGMQNIADQRNVPLWLGETGENSNTWFTEAIRLVEDHGIGWAWWPLKKLGINNPLEIKMDPGYQKVVDYWNGNGDRPSADDAYMALMQFAENLKFENNNIKWDVIDAKIRQPYSHEAKPYKENIISANEPTVIYATNYDLGRHGVAYKDNEFQNITGQAGGQAWNLGYAYRNDGVDIESCQDEITNGYNVGWTENGEWLQYTLTVEEAGFYTVKFRAASSGSNGRLSLKLSDGKLLAKIISLPNTGAYQSWESTEVKDVFLEKGTNAIRLHVEVGGFNINYLEFNKQEGPLAEQPELLKGSIKHLENDIILNFNHFFEDIPENHGFVVKVNDKPIEIEGVRIPEDQKQSIVIGLNETVVYGDEVLLTYSGTSITTESGSVVSPFSDLPIIIETTHPVRHIPGQVRASDFTVNYGFELEESSDSGGGFNVGHTDAGDYLDFLVFIERSGVYKVDYRVASQSTGGNLKIQQVFEDGSTEDLGGVNFNATGGWQSWRTVTGDEVQFTRGLQTVRFYASSSLFNINWFRFTFQRELVTSMDGSDTFGEHVVVFPNPNKGNFNLAFPALQSDANRVLIKDSLGKAIYSEKLDKGVSEINIQKNLAKGLYIVMLEQNGKKLLTNKIIVTGF